MNRAVDVALAGLGLVVASPLLAAAALAMKLEDGGPVLFRQTRVGKDGGDFELLKLRSMVVDAERQGPGTRSTGATRASRASGASSAARPSTSCRSCGTSSAATCRVIGPRPTLRYQVERYTERQRRRLEVRPGLTGWAQIKGRATLPWADRIELDVWYVEHRSPRLDLEDPPAHAARPARGNVQGRDRGLALGDRRSDSRPRRALRSRDAEPGFAAGHRAGR